ncbi:lytic transglycosylase domain-containing protein [Bordetella sp. 02P26C-1]|uniref:lytic transglycosylase domain-containing protein n=1 Tax=Bordetella sp. 02P26C-1 TaxID=2683195 RepID=UPI001355259E|nr:lytic transglycosylase domain-containing protein [Bordetella sp. 02P26C-1]MVW79373.1 transglycosylase SLT domain-containing protein [Bordetella sp. 02P26C-1]
MQQWLESRRYQKSATAESRRALTAGTGDRRFRRWLPALALITVACSSVDAQQKQVSAAGPAHASSARLHVPPVKLAGLPPTPQTPAFQAVMAAREAYERKQWSALGMVAPQARGDVLGDYPQFWLLNYQVWNAPAAQFPKAEVQQFLREKQNTYLGERLRGNWILAATRRGDFETARELGEVPEAGSQTQCAMLEARHMTGQRAKPHEALAVFKPGTDCWKLYDQLVADGVLGWEQLQPQLRAAIEVNELAHARKFAAYLFEPQDQKTYDALMKSPMKWLTRQDHQRIGRNEKELVAIALARLARQDLDVGDSYLQREWASHLTKSDLAWVRSQFALIAALNLDSRADAWYRQAGNAVELTEYNAAWRVRSALRQPKIDWRWVEDSINHMPKSQQEEPVWIYWKARADAARGRHEQARRGYASIADQYNFYGQLAAEELGRSITVPPRPAPVTDAEMQEARANASLRRAVHLFRLGWRSEAVGEWNYALRGMSDRQLLAAAELARAEDIYDRVVNTSERTRNEVDFTQRYIAPFEGRVTAQANSIGLDPAWVYGLIRQESRFIMNARSHVGASGLMQLMPATAKYVASRIGMADFTPASVNDFDTNTILGTNYLNIVLQGLDGSQVLASAGYNAGPGRPKTWRAKLSHPVEGAIFAETIPFTETRLYVKHVLSNATYYAAMFSGQPQSLKARLGEIVPPGVVRTAESR